MSSTTNNKRTANSGSGRKSGIPNYQKDKLLNIIDSIRPIGPNEWQEVARLYKVASAEVDERPYLDVKRHFNERLCNGGKKPTGRSAPAADVARALVIQRKIMERTNAGVYGDDDDGDSNDDEGDTDEYEIQNDFTTAVVFLPLVYQEETRFLLNQ